MDEFSDMTTNLPTKEAYEVDLDRMEVQVIDDVTLGKIIKESAMMGKNYVKGRKLKLDMNLRSHMKFLELLKCQPITARRLPNTEHISIKNVRRGIKDDIKSFLQHSFPEKCDKFSFNTGSVTTEHVKVDAFSHAEGDEQFGPLFKCFYSTKSEVVVSGLEFDTYVLGKIFKGNSNNKKLSILNCKIYQNDDDEDDDDDIYINDDNIEYIIKFIDFTGTGDEGNSNWAENPKIIEKLIEVMGDEPTLRESLKKICFKECGISDDRFRELLDENDLGHVVIQDYIIDQEEAKSEGGATTPSMGKSKSERPSVAMTDKTFSSVNDNSESQSNSGSQQNEGNDVMEPAIWKDLCSENQMDAEASLTGQFSVSLEKNFPLCQELQELKEKGQGKLPNLNKFRIYDINEPKSSLLVSLLKDSMPDECNELWVGSNHFPKFLRPFAFYRKTFFSILDKVKEKVSFSSFIIKTNDMNNLIQKWSHLEEVFLRNLTIEFDDLNFDEEVDYKVKHLYFAFSKEKVPANDFADCWLTKVLKAVKNSTLADSLEAITVLACGVDNDEAQALLEELELDSIDLKVSED